MNVMAWIWPALQFMRVKGTGRRTRGRHCGGVDAAYPLWFKGGA
jgi:hypothetical protein